MSHRQLIWEALLDASYRARYYGHLASQLQGTERLLAVLSAVLSSTSFVTLISKVSVPYLAEVLVLAAAVCSTLMATYRFGKTATLSGSFFKRWAEAKTELQVLWLRLDELDPAEATRQWRTIQDKVIDMNEVAPVEFRLRPKLAQRCQQEVLREMHLEAA